MTHFSLCWDAQKILSQGLSSLQQNSEYVDMTLAADGHLVKVHKLVVALASPYLKEMINSATCTHPVVFLNKINYTTLCALLEYIYTGEVMVSLENLNSFIEAGKELHIKGIEDMAIQQVLASQDKDETHQEFDDEVCYFQVGTETSPNKQSFKNEDHLYEESELETFDESQIDAIDNENDDTIEETKTVDNKGSTLKNKIMQYTVSNQGSLQMILNRFVYYVKYTTRNNVRQWRCVDYINKPSRCPASVITKNDMVIKRVGAHCHSFHDKKILKKVKAGTIYSAIADAEREGTTKKEQMSELLLVPQKNSDTEMIEK